MMIYKHRETAEAVGSIFSLYDAARKAAESIAYNAENLSPQRAREKYPQIAEEFREKRSVVLNLVSVAAAAAMKRAQEKQAAELKIGEAAEDFNLLALPVTLTGKELALLIDRNLGNKLFLRAAEQYAKKHDIQSADVAEAMKHVVAAVDYEETARRLANYLETRIPGENIINDLAGIGGYEREMKAIEGSGLLKQLDDAV